MTLWDVAEVIVAEPSLQAVLRLRDVEEFLNRIVIKCPNTGKMIYTGYSMDPRTFGAIPIEQMDPIECPACHRMHRWGKEDALFEREGPAPKQE